MSKSHSLKVKLIIKIVLAVLFTLLVTLIFPLHKIPVASCSYGPDNSYGWDSVEKVYINQKNPLKVSYFTGRQSEIVDIKMLTYSVEGDGNINIAITNTDGVEVGSYCINSSQISSDFNNVIPVKTEYLNQYATYYFDISCDGDLSVGIYSVDKEINPTINLLYENSETNKSLLMNVDTLEYATDGFGLFIWVLLFVICTIIFWPWKKIDKIIRTFIITLLTVIMIITYSYYSIFRGATGNGKKLFFVFAASTVIAVCLHSAILKFWNNRIQEKAWIVSILIWGTVYLLLMPPFSYSDEYSHYAKANEYASELMGMTAFDENGGVYVRECDVIENNPWPSSQVYEDYYDGFFVSSANNNYVVLPDSTIFTGYNSKGVMLPYEIGIVLGRKLNLSGPMTNSLATGVGFLVYVLLMWISIRIIPHGKWAIFVLGQMPLSLSLATAISYDYLNMAGIILIFSCIYRFVATKENMEWGYVVMLIVLGIITFPIKYAYIPIIFLILIIPDAQIRIVPGRWAKVLKIGIILISVLSIFQDSYFFSRIFHFNENVVESVAESEIVFEEATFDMIYSADFWLNPSEVLSDAESVSISLFNSFYNQTDYYLFGMSGEKIGMGDNFIPEYVKAIWLLILVISIIGMESNEKYLDKKQRLIIGMVAFVCAGATFVAMMLFGTPRGYNYYPSVCARYLLPIILPLCLALRSESVGLKKDISVETFVSIVDICQLVGVIYLFAGYIKR